MYIILADSGDSLMKFVFFGIIIFVFSIGKILKMLGFEDSDEQGAKPARRGGRPSPSRIDEDMENARRRLREMMQEQHGKSLTPDFPEAPKPVLYEVQEVAEPKKEVANPKAKPVEVEAMQEAVFDYNAELEASEKLLEQSMIAYKKVAPSKELEAISASEIRDGGIRDLMHDKKFLKKSIVISEILDKPLSLR